MAEGALERWSKDHRYGVRLDPEVIATLLTACRRSGRMETGGILIGRYTDSLRLASVTAASLPTTDTKAGTHWLVRGIQGLQRWLERIWHEDRSHYVGEWHFHPFAAPMPSSQDEKQLRKIASTLSYQCETPLLLIIGGNPSDQWSVYAAVYTRAGERHVLSETRGISPPTTCTR